MRFQLTDEQRHLRSEAREFAQDIIKPRSKELDQAGEHPTDIMDELSDFGYTGLTIPEAYGGLGRGATDLAILIEELSAALMSVASTLGLHLGVAEVIQQFGTDQQRETYLPEMAAYDTVGALGLSEQSAGSDKLQMETTAEQDGDEWVLNGHKQWITNLLHADYVLTYAKTGSDSESPHNITAFLVPTDDFTVDEVWDTLGARSVKSPRATFSDVRVSDQQRVGEVGEAYVQRSKLRTGVNVPARGVGIARAALDDTVAYTSEREQFDQSIGEFQGIRWEVAEMAERVDVARLLTLRAAERSDRGVDTTRAFSMAKTAATQAAVDNANKAIQFHGGIGYTTEQHVERYLRDARLLTIAGGPNEGHKDTLAEAVYDEHPRK
ncbi:acyl-CoA dehydrogenase family protein [Halomicroarcula sp. F13]|uniref:Acyl-CoA dehydrogenase family protein n=1 Tax=Haloarcula rubra TaxID=2487747 RepID=A0AAW4PSX6_9EURY|nr:acyl-CoA dehydrogenase family protein [Halomicroarcula rubra]MBX0324371.1 acyl-CoA dehydrogenase family protein [Halomicroarcula rubra]